MAANTTKMSSYDFNFLMNKLVHQV